VQATRQRQHSNPDAISSLLAGASDDDEDFFSEFAVDLDDDQGEPAVPSPKASNGKAAAAANSKTAGAGCFTQLDHQHTPLTSV
jgi:hypothetical protein